MAGVLSTLKVADEGAKSEAVGQHVMNPDLNEADLVQAPLAESLVCTNGLSIAQSAVGNGSSETLASAGNALPSDAQTWRNYFGEAR